MDLRIRGLERLDPLAVPLPAGTEVTTRVERAVGDRRVPLGAAGRVVATDGEEVEVEVVGVGRVRYRRGELVPRKLGQARSALRRAASWESLHPCAVIEATVGSHAWGLAGEGSDVDRRGVFVLPFPWTCGLAEPPQDLLSADGSTALWEAGKAVRQALAADPNTLELLFVPSVRALDPMGAMLLDAREAFVSAGIYGSFGRYALAQLHRLRRSLRLFEHRDRVLEWLQEEPSPSLDETARRLAALSDGSGDPGVGSDLSDDEVLQAKEYLKQLYRSMHDRGLLATQDFSALVTFARRGVEGSAAPELPRELRPKNAYNLLRLIATAVGWLETGTPHFEMQGAFRERLLAIKRGEVPLEEVIRLAEGMTPDLEEARKKTVLPAAPDVRRADAVLRHIREEAARRWVERVPGPHGAGAPPVPDGVPAVVEEE